MLNYVDFKPEVKDLKEVIIAALEYEGDYEGNGEIFDILLDQILKWAIPNKLFNFPQETKLISIYEEKEVKKKLIFGITIDEDIDPPSNIKKIKVAPGKYVVGRFEVLPTEFGEAWGNMYRWIAENGYVPAEKNSYEIQYNDSCKHKEHKHIIDICIPVVE